MTAKLKSQCDPIEFFGRVHYGAEGKLQSVELSVRGYRFVTATRSVLAENVGELFKRAYEISKILLLTERLVPEAEDLPNP